MNDDNKIVGARLADAEREALGATVVAPAASAPIAPAPSSIEFSHGRPFLRMCYYCGIETHERLTWQVQKPGAVPGATVGDRSIPCCGSCWEGLRRRQVGIARALTFGWAKREGGTWFCGFCTDRTDEFLAWHTEETLRRGVDPNAHACCRRCRALLKGLR